MTIGGPTPSDRRKQVGQPSFRGDHSQVLITDDHQWVDQPLLSSGLCLPTSSRASCSKSLPPTCSRVSSPGRRAFDTLAAGIESSCASPRLEPLRIPL